MCGRITTKKLRAQIALRPSIKFRIIATRLYLITCVTAVDELLFGFGSGLIAEAVAVLRRLGQIPDEQATGFTMTVTAAAAAVTLGTVVAASTPTGQVTS